MRSRVDCFVYDDMWSYWHTILGTVTKIVAYFVPWLALAIFVIFVIYEVVEDRWFRTVGRAKCDIIEYAIGYMIGDIVAAAILDT